MVILIERGLSSDLYSFGKQATCDLNQSLLVHIRIAIDLPTRFPSKICKVLCIALLGFVWEVEVDPENSFLCIGSNPVKIWNFFEGLVGERYGVCLLDLTRSSFFLARSYQMELPPRLSEKVLLCF